MYGPFGVNLKNALRALRILTASPVDYETTGTLEIFGNPRSKILLSPLSTSAVRRSETKRIGPNKLYFSVAARFHCQIDLDLHHAGLPQHVGSVDIFLGHLPRLGNGKRALHSVEHDWSRRSLNPPSNLRCVPALKLPKIRRSARNYGIR